MEAAREEEIEGGGGERMCLLYFFLEVRRSEKIFSGIQDH